MSNRKEIIRINALDLSDQELKALSKARSSGVLRKRGSVVLNKLADGGAQMILAAGKPLATKLYPDGHWFELTPEDKIFLDKIFLDALAE